MNKLMWFWIVLVVMFISMVIIQTTKSFDPKQQTIYMEK